MLHLARVAAIAAALIATTFGHPERSRADPLIVEASSFAAPSRMVESHAPAVQLAMFYHPPRDGTGVNVVVDQFSSAILTRGDERYRDQLRAAGFRGPILQYLVANEASGPAGLRSALDPCGPYLDSGNDVSGIAQDFCQVLHPHEDAFLHNGRGERLYSTLSWQEQTGTKTRYYYLMNPAAAHWRRYFAQHAAENARALGYTGLFIDNIDRSLERGAIRSVNSDGLVSEFSNDEAYRESVTEMLEVLRQHIGELPMWGNVISSYHRPADGHIFTQKLDAVMNEYFIGLWRGQLPSPPLWEAQLQQAEQVLAGGRGFIAVAQGDRGDSDRLRFALASFLLVAQPQAYFRYSDDNSYDEAWLYEEYSARLGPALGARYEVSDGWRRDFRCGFVQVNPTAHQGTIVTDRSALVCQS